METSIDVAIRPGAHVQPRGVRYCVWAPDHERLAVQVRRADGTVARLPLEPQPEGYHVGEDAIGAAGNRYIIELSDGTLRPDPASRFQPEGVHGWSECIDPHEYRWRCTGWRRPGWRGQSIYELHVGTFTREGTFQSAARRLEHIAALGVRAIELMPVADFPGSRNWGYDGVALYAPARCYGRPDDLRAFVDAAHEHGLAVILDVVYNHLGPDGNYLSQFGRAYFNPEHHTPWGQALNFDGPDNRPVRDYFLHNAVAWLDEFRFDGLRLDATHAIRDDSPRHLLAELADVAQERGAFLIAEDERNSCDILRRPDGAGAGLDAAWADDFHHQVRVALTGVQDAYFKNYAGSPEQVAATLRHGWFYRGQPYPSWKGRPRGEPCDHLSPHAFVLCIENHDQVGNRGRGERLEHLIAPAAFRAASGLLCLAPYPLLIFMGQEWAASAPFLFFTDHAGELGTKVSEGRRKEFSEFARDHASGLGTVPDPQALETFTRSKLSWDELRLSPYATVLHLYRACLRERGAWLEEVAADRARWSVEALERAVAIRYRPAAGPERLVLTSLEGGARLSLQADSRLRPPAGHSWQLALDSNASWIETAAGAPPERVVTCATSALPGVDTLVFTAPATLLLVARPTEERVRS
ncbi:malto-oligosyltrehalose trehalohydrolase [Opitutus terrae]|uniref:Malto-oligosyltrehalose trehalohydrolase n=1 Tax=Opitutus terrae (strain DSM 11246 / JCM 15787 / PB90-1) TaxID=452637 RepID=B1ZYQ8_OPITP|nr:malto-oligosyltrehalose trehalohydrolase [Opitutus terrae]ACB75294.1 malto-oligosyltrehalose trehalohydrolase [Opitutus terrae PB90-1]